MVRETENYLWPDAITPERKAEIGGSEIVQVYPYRHSVPTELWTRLLDQAEAHVGILLYAGMFLTDDPTFIKRLRKKAEDERRSVCCWVIQPVLRSTVAAGKRASGREQ